LLLAQQRGARAAGLAVDVEMFFSRNFTDDDNAFSRVVQVAVGGKHALLLTDEGIVYSWGSNNDWGQLGRNAGTDAHNMQTPTPITDNFRNAVQRHEVLVQIACGLNHCLAVSQDGKLYAWGLNKAGQLGLEGWKTEKKDDPPKQGTPQIVTIPSGAKVKSCSCGPESSACVTFKGEVYVWGAMGYYLFQGNQNCTVPIKLRGMPPRSLGSEYVPDMIAIFKDKAACTVARAKVKDDLESKIESMKRRSTALATAARSQRHQKEMHGGADGDGQEWEDLKGLNDELRTQKEDLFDEVKKMQAKLERNKEDLQRVYRELTICDQQDTAYNEASSNIEVQKSEENATSLSHYNLDSKLNDINQFRNTNRKNKMSYLQERDRLEQDQWRFKGDLVRLKDAKNQADARSKLLKALQKGDFGSTANSTVDDGLRIASSKREELSATFPQTLSGTGRFTGFLEAFSISERALQDVSSALKEVSAVVEGVDGTTLEEMLELNLKLRKEYNQVIWEKLATVDPEVGQAAMMSTEQTGLLHQFFRELSHGRSHEPAIEDSDKPAKSGAFGFRGLKSMWSK